MGGLKIHAWQEEGWGLYGWWMGPDWMRMIGKRVHKAKQWKKRLRLEKMYGFYM